MLVTSRSQVMKQARIDRQKKITYDIRFAADLRTLYNKIARDFYTVYSTSGHSISATSYRTDMVQILQKWYFKVGDSFKDNIRSGAPKEWNPRLFCKSVESTIDADLLTFTTHQTQSQADIIIATINDEMLAALGRTYASAVNAGEDPSNAYIAKSMRDWLRAFGSVHSLMVAITETNTAAENAKFTEAATLVDTFPKNFSIFIETKSRLVEAPMSSSNTGKTWVSNLDHIVREWHAVADFQNVEIEGDFVVMGEQLSYPGDKTNASPENYINCRCNAIYYTGEKAQEEIADDTTPISPTDREARQTLGMTQKEIRAYNSEANKVKNFVGKTADGTRTAELAKDYTEEYLGGGWKQANKFLIDSKGDLSVVDDKVKRLITGLNSIPIRHEGNVYRGLKLPTSQATKLISELGKTKRYNFHSLTSTSMSRQVAIDFAHSAVGPRDSGKILLSIDGKTGVNIGGLAKPKWAQAEAEVLFTPGKTFKVTSISKDLSNELTIVKLKEVFNAPK